MDLLIFSGQSNMQGQTEGLPACNETVDGAYDTEEGCLSLLDGSRKCKRYKTIKVQFQTLEMKTHTKNFTDWTAQIIQHEVDHCDGVLI